MDIVHIKPIWSEILDILSNLISWISGISGYLKNKVWYIGLCLIGVIGYSLTSPEFSEIIDIWLTWKFQIHLLTLWLGKNVSLMVLYMIGLLVSGLWTVGVVDILSVPPQKRQLYEPGFTILEMNA
jgi:hypothetical protein